ncbi:MAG: acyl-ACP--UDP-N-acetylglucosamine O-acyltransferase [Polyangiaceae bacterium]|nr:acyl-ACP--UDP-N-acetylglucosamine O-acyltransferase [Polyangiaceae bacterium]
MSQIHQTAVVDGAAKLGDGVRIGPFCVVEGDVELGAGTELVSHVVIRAGARLGANNQVHPFSVIGGPPQDKSHTGRESWVQIGDDNVFRESCTVHGGTHKGDGTTRIGNSGLFMVGAHVAHDCDVGDRVILTNYVSLGGHVVVEHAAVLGGHVAVAPFCRIGRIVFAAGGAMIERSVPPFLTVAGDRARVRGVNSVGLRRNQVPEDSIRALRSAQRTLYAGGEPLRVAAERLRAEASDDFVRQLLTAILAET